MSNDRPNNPYAAPALVREEREAASHPDGSPARPGIEVARRNLVGLALTAVGMVVFEVAHISFFKIFRDFKLELPLLTRALENDWLVYGVIFILLATFLAGLLSRPKKRSALIGSLGLLGLALATIYVFVALFLPLISLQQSLSP